MTVIDLADRRRRRDIPDLTPEPAPERTSEPTPEQALAAAEARIAMLERTLALTAREHARARQRAERAEAVLRAAGLALAETAAS